VVIRCDTIVTVVRPVVVLEFEPMRKTVHELGRWSAFALAGLIVQDWFHGLELGRWIIPLGVLLGFACVAFVVTWPPFRKRIPYRLVRVNEAPKTQALSTGGTILSVQPKQPVSLREAEEATERRRARVVRANVQSVIDELAWARRIIMEALEDEGSFWTQEIHWTTWENVKNSLAREKGFHAAYNATREAWDALQRAEIDRLNHDGARSEIRPWVQRHIETALEKSKAADLELFSFLASDDDA
jgi:hypothetical protein